MMVMYSTGRMRDLLEFNDFVCHAKYETRMKFSRLDSINVIIFP